MSEANSIEPDWVSVAEVGKEEEAAIVRGFLDSQAIDAIVDSKKFHQEPVNFGDLSPIAIMVPADQEQRALEVLASQTVSVDAKAGVDPEPEEVSGVDNG